MRFSTITAAAAMIAGVSAQSVTATGVQVPSSAPLAGAPRVQGCWSSPGKLTLVNATVPFNTDDFCGKDICLAKGKKVAALYRAYQCWCGDSYPPLSEVVDDTNCNIPCPGYPQHACGGKEAWTIINSGLDPYGVENDADPTSSASSEPAGVTSGPTSAVTSSSSQPTQSNSSGGGTNTAAVAAGVVVGIVAIAGIGAGIWFFMRKRRNSEIEEEHRRNAAVNAFINNGSTKGPSSSSGMSMTDARMNPTLGDRRMSSGSIADNQDYSRRILRVTNA